MENIQNVKHEQLRELEKRLEEANMVKIVGLFLVLLLIVALILSSSHVKTLSSELEAQLQYVESLSEELAETKAAAEEAEQETTKYREDYTAISAELSKLQSEYEALKAATEKEHQTLNALIAPLKDLYGVIDGISQDMEETEEKTEPAADGAETDVKTD